MSAPVVVATVSQVRDALFTKAQSGYSVLEKRDLSQCDKWSNEMNSFLKYAINAVKYAQYEQDKRLQCKNGDHQGILCFTVAWVTTACRTVDACDISPLCTADGLVSQSKTKGKP